MVCTLDNLNGDYGCSGPLPGGWRAINLVGGGPPGPAGLRSTTQTVVVRRAGRASPGTAAQHQVELSAGQLQGWTMPVWSPGSTAVTRSVSW